MQYRLGTLGFLSTEDSAAPGIFLYSTFHRLGPLRSSVQKPLQWLLCSPRYIPVLYVYHRLGPLRSSLQKPLQWLLCSPRYIPVLHSTGWDPWDSCLLKTLQLQVYSCTPQHRLGTFGFLSTEDSAAPGIFLYSISQAGNSGLPLY
jgi:hypothetical protein